ncbi:hypothetical protein ElyMa_005906100 [Elysia marginata]|uniref:Uncharacterized protein n=1 Tax=Elysia marginata TaxID=1093978 RepID=A0AAV4G6A7_9GAST|nr:hypothetical protein ElyMa_005906100 [Elysia marginata]
MVGVRKILFNCGLLEVWIFQSRPRRADVPSANMASLAETEGWWNGRDSVNKALLGLPYDNSYHQVDLLTNLSVSQPSSRPSSRQL